jgi:hypothetical protein
LSGVKKLNEADIRKEIAKIIKKRNDDIKRFVSMPNDVSGTLSAENLKKKGLSYSRWIAIHIGIWIGYGLAAVTLLILICYILYKTYKSSFRLRFMTWFMLLVSYSISVFYIHDTVFDGYTNIFNMLLSFVPIAITLLLFLRYPNITKPLDNTIGYFCVTRAPFIEGFDVMKRFKSRLFPKEGMLDETNSEISFNWLLTTFDEKYIDSCLDQLKGGREINTANGSIVTDFYIDEPTSDDIDKIRTLVNLKKTFGRGASLLIASAFGLAGSMVYSVPLTITLV